MNICGDSCMSTNFFPLFYSNSVNQIKTFYFHNCEVKAATATAIK